MDLDFLADFSCEEFFFFFVLIKFQNRLLKFSEKYINTFASIWGGPGAFGVFDDDIALDRFVVDPNALDDVEFNADEITFELDGLL